MDERELAKELADAFSRQRGYDGGINIPWDSRSSDAKEAWVVVARKAKELLNVTQEKEN